MAKLPGRGNSRTGGFLDQSKPDTSQRGAALLAVSDLAPSDASVEPACPGGDAICTSPVCGKRRGPEVAGSGGSSANRREWLNKAPARQPIATHARCQPIAQVIAPPCDDNFQVLKEYLHNLIRIGCEAKQLSWRNPSQCW